MATTHTLCLGHSMRVSSIVRGIQHYPLGSLSCFTISRMAMAQSSRQLSTSSAAGPSECKTVHVLGVGNIGLLVAHSIAQAHGVQSVTLLFHRATLAKEWDEAGRGTELVRDGTADRQSGYNFEILQASPRAPDIATPQYASRSASGPGDNYNTGAIHNLVIATKASKTIAAFSAIRHRLTRQSTVLFCQNGMGIMDELAARFPDLELGRPWPAGAHNDHDRIGVYNDNDHNINKSHGSNNHRDPSAGRPTFIAGIVTHGVYSTQPFRVVHAGCGRITIGSLCLPAPADQPQATLGFLGELLIHTPTLAAVHVPTLQLLQARLEKLVVNAIINPLTALFNCRNGQLFRDSDTSAQSPIHTPAARLMHYLLSETCQVIRSLPDVQALPGSDEIFSVARMKDVVLDVATKTGANTSSMLQDFRANRQTEIEYINGYIVRKGAEVGVDCGINQRVLRFVEEGQQISLDEVLKIFPELLE